MIGPLRAPLGIGAFLLLALLFQPDAVRLGAATASPVVDQSIVATYRAGEIELTGVDLGGSSSASAILLDYGPRSTSILSTSPLVDVWDSTRIVVSLPWEVVSGELRVIVDSKPSDSVELQVYEYEAFEIPISGRDQNGTYVINHPLAVAVGSNGSVWLNEEYHSEIKFKSLEAADFLGVEIPQAEGLGIFAQTASGHSRARFSSLGEDVEIGRDGNVWFTQGGANFYPDYGGLLNTSRVVSFDPERGDFACYNLPVDNAALHGVLVDDDRGVVWYSEGRTNTIGGFRPDLAEPDCSYDPYADTAHTEACSQGLEGGCHVRFELKRTARPAHLALDPDGNIWFTESFGNRVSRLSPETGEIVEVPLPATIKQEYPGSWIGGHPWELAFDSQGSLWVSEFFDATVARIDTRHVDRRICSTLAADGTNPCITDVYVATDGFDGWTIHSVMVDAADRAWFGAGSGVGDQLSPRRGYLGFVATAYGDQIVLLPEVSDITSVAGIAQDPTTKDIWFAQFWDHKVGRLRLSVANQQAVPGCPSLSADECLDLDSDGDGCTDAQELGSDERLGGRRDPHNFWDFYDTPNRSGERDGKVDLLNDIIGVAQRLGSHDRNGLAEMNRYSDPFSPLPGDPTAYHPAFDRSPSESNGDSWDMGPPDGRIDLVDILGLIIQFRHSCAR